MRFLMNDSYGWRRATNLRGLVCCAALLAASAGAARQAYAADDASKQTVIVVIGAPGEAQFGEDFAKSADAWADASRRAGANYIEIGRSNLTADTTSATAAAPAGEKTDRQRFQDALADQTQGNTALWIVLIGHGTYDGKDAKFNLHGPNFSDTELATWLKPVKRPIALIDCSSASAPFLNRISGPNRVVITATRAGSEVNYCRFGLYMAQAMANPADDIDRDGQTSLLESFLAASRAVVDFYEGQGRLATEHALIDDNGDAQGTPADWFEGTRATKSARAGAKVDGTLANQWFLIPSADEKALNPQTRAQRDALEQKIDALRQKKATLSEKDYYAQLDALLLSLARVQVHTGAQP